MAYLETEPKRRSGFPQTTPRKVSIVSSKMFHDQRKAQQH